MQDDDQTESNQGPPVEYYDNMAVSSQLNGV